jgi:hypothetical protein
MSARHPDLDDVLAAVKTIKQQGGSIAQRLAHLLPVPAAPGSNHGSGKNISDVALLIDSGRKLNKS